MSLSYRNRQKAKKRQRTEEEKSVAQKIRAGKMPKRFFVKNADSTLERKSPKPNRKPVLTWNTMDTYSFLTKKEGSKS